MRTPNTSPTKHRDATGRVIYLGDYIVEPSTWAQDTAAYVAQVTAETPKRIRTKTFMKNPAPPYQCVVDLLYTDSSDSSRYTGGALCLPHRVVVIPPHLAYDCLRRRSTNIRGMLKPQLSPEEFIEAMASMGVSPEYLEYVKRTTPL